MVLEMQVLQENKIKVLRGEIVFNAKDFVITNIKHVEMWSPVPTYEKINISYCIKMGLGCLMGSFEAIDGLKDYLANRKKNNKKYKDFWSDTSLIKFNDDKTQYVCMQLNTIKDVEIT